MLYNFNLEAFIILIIIPVILCMLVSATVFVFELIDFKKFMKKYYYVDINIIKMAYKVIKNKLLNK